MKFEINPIGIIFSPFNNKDECPIQGVINKTAKGKIEIFSEYENGLKNIEFFSHLYIIYIFDRAGDICLLRKPFLDDEYHGIFASRHPARPNKIGFSIVKLDKRINNVLHVSEIDVLNNTPLLDIKPYIPKFDFRENASNGWLEGKDFRDKPIDRE